MPCDESNHYYHHVNLDRSTQLSDKKHKLFRGEVKGIAYVYHPQHRQRQYILAVGDDSEYAVGGKRADNSVIKV